MFDGWQNDGGENLTQGTVKVQEILVRGKKQSFTGPSANLSRRGSTRLATSSQGFEQRLAKKQLVRNK